MAAAAGITSLAGRACAYSSAPHAGFSLSVAVGRSRFGDVRGIQSFRLGLSSLVVSSPPERRDKHVARPKVPLGPPTDRAPSTASGDQECDGLAGCPRPCFAARTPATDSSALGSLATRSRAGPRDHARPHHRPPRGREVREYHAAQREHGKQSTLRTSIRQCLMRTCGQVALHPGQPTIKP